MNAWFYVVALVWVTVTVVQVIQLRRSERSRINTAVVPWVGGKCDSQIVVITANGTGWALCESADQAAFAFIRRKLFVLAESHDDGRDALLSCCKPNAAIVVPSELLPSSTRAYLCLEGKVVKEI
jgi:hypothetical protein